MLRLAVVMFVLLLALPARAETVAGSAEGGTAQTQAAGDLVGRLVPGSSAEAAKSLAEGMFDVDGPAEGGTPQTQLVTQLGAELDLLATAAELRRPRSASTLVAVQKASGAKYWSEDFDLVAGARRSYRPVVRQTPTRIAWCWGRLASCGRSRRMGRSRPSRG